MITLQILTETPVTPLIWTRHSLWDDIVEFEFEKITETGTNVGEMRVVLLTVRQMQLICYST